MADFKEAFALMAQHEGGYANDPNDKGGETYMGISRRNHPGWNGWAIIDAHKPLKPNTVLQNEALQALVLAFYKANYWDNARLGDIVSERVASFTFDWYVHSGSPALRSLQKIVGVADDGVIGQATLAAVNACAEDDLVPKLIACRVAFYNGIAERNPAQKVYLKGWLKRAESYA